MNLKFEIYDPLGGGMILDYVEASVWNAVWDFIREPIQQSIGPFIDHKVKELIDHKVKDYEFGR